MATIHIKIITPKKIIFEDDIESITVPSSQGEITVLPHHANLFSLLADGIVTVRKSGSEEYFSIGSGYLETNGSNVTILVSRAYGQDEIDQELTEKAKKEATQILSESKNMQDRQEATNMLRKSMIDSKLLKKRKATRSFSENA